VRRSAIDPTSASPMARTSSPAPRAGRGSFRRRRSRPVGGSAARQSGWSVTLFSSVRSRARANHAAPSDARDLGRAAEGVGILDALAAGVRARMPLPSRRRRTAAADASCPAWGGARGPSRRTARRLPRSASTERAHAACAARRTSNPSAIARTPTAVAACVPLMSASPSLAPRTKGSSPASRRCSTPGRAGRRGAPPPPR